MLFAGIGFGLIYLPAVVCVGYYFESKRALATGIAVCGSGKKPAVNPIQYFDTKTSSMMRKIMKKSSNFLFFYGLGVGTFVFAPFASALLTIMDWRGANLVFSGLILSCGVRIRTD